MCRNCLKPSPRRPSRFASGHAAVVEGERPRVGGVPAHLPVRLADARSPGVPFGTMMFEISGRRPPVTRGDRHAARDVGAGVGDELLGAVDHPLAVVERARGCGCCRRRSRPRARSGRRRRAARPTHSSRQPLLPSARRCPRGRSASCRARCGRAIVIADRGVDARQLLDRERVGERVGARRRRTPPGRGSPSARARPSCATIS